MDATDLTTRDLAAAQAYFALLDDAFARVRAHKAEIAYRQWAIDLGQGIERAQARIVRLSAAQPDVPPGEIVAALIELGQVIREQVSFEAIAIGIQDEHDEMEDEIGLVLVGTLHAAVRDARQVELRLTETAKDLSEMKEDDMPSPKAPPPPSGGRPHGDTTGTGGKSGSAIEAGTGSGTGTDKRPYVDGAKSGMDERLVYEAMSMFQRGTAQAARPAIARSDVLVRMTASSDALGLPTAAAIATIGKGREPDVRAQVIDALQRNFVGVEHDGVRSYRRLERPLVQATSAAGRPTQHGLGLFRTASLKSTVGIVRSLLLDLRSAATAATFVGGESERLLARTDDASDDLLRCTADPMGLVSGEAEGAVRRLLLAVADWLDHGGIAAADTLRELASQPDVGRIIHGLKPGLLAHDRRLGPVGGQEAAARLDALVEALAAIARTIVHGDRDDTGQRAALAEQALTLIRPSAEALIVAYEALGSTREEQDVAFFGGAARISIGQFAGWAKRLSDRFAGADMVVAAMTYEDLAVLDLDLKRLEETAGKLRAASVRSGRRLGMIGALGQLEELAGLIADARTAVAELIAIRQP